MPFFVVTQCREDDLRHVLNMKPTSLLYFENDMYMYHLVAMIGAIYIYIYIIMLTTLPKIHERNHGSVNYNNLYFTTLATSHQ